MSTQPRRVPLNEYYFKLGQMMRQIREAAGKTTREVAKPGGVYGSGSISNVEGGYSPPSVDMIKAYARMGGSYIDLMALRDKAQNPVKLAEVATDEFERQLLDPHTDPRVLRRGYVFDLEDGTTYVGSDRVVKRNLYKVAIRPTSPSAQFFVFRHGYDPDMRRGVASVKAGSGCELEFVEEQDNGILLAVLHFDQAKVDEFGRCNFTYAINIDSTIPTEPADIVTTNSLMVHIIKRIQFEPPATPQKIWWIRGDDAFQPQLEPTADQLLEVNSTHFYFHEFYDVEAEDCGLAWEWNLGA